MAVSPSISLPTEEELTVPEVNVSGVVLRASAFHLGKYCENQNNVRSNLCVILYPDNIMVGCNRSKLLC